MFQPFFVDRDPDVDGCSSCCSSKPTTNRARPPKVYIHTPLLPLTASFIFPARPAGQGHRNLRDDPREQGWGGRSKLSSRRSTPTPNPLATCNYITPLTLLRKCTRIVWRYRSNNLLFGGGSFAASSWSETRGGGRKSRFCPFDDLVEAWKVVAASSSTVGLRGALSLVMMACWELDTCAPQTRYGIGSLASPRLP